MRFPVATVFLLLIAVPQLSTQLAAQDAGSRLRTMIRADAAEAVPKPDSWPDLRSTSLAAKAARDRAIFADLARIQPDSLRDDDRVLFDLFRRKVDTRLRQLRLRMYLTPFWEDERFSSSQYESPWVLRGAVNELASPVLAGELRLRKLRAFPAYVAQIIALMREGAASGVLPARSVAQYFTLGLTEGIDAARFDGAFRKLYEPAKEQERIRAEADALVQELVIPAIREYVSFLNEEYVPACPEIASISSWPDGESMLRILVERETSTSMTPQDIYALGTSEVARIRDAMGAVVRSIGWMSTLDQFLAEARTDPRYYFTSEDELLNAYRTAEELVAEAGPTVVGGARALEIVPMRTAATSGSYSVSQRRILVDVSRLDLRARFEVVPVILHEGPIGHGIERELWRSSQADAQELATLVGVGTAYSEGWGLYAESLGEDLGFYTDPLSKFGELNMQLLRAARAVIDTGIHAFGWTREQAETYFVEQTGRAPAMAQAEVERTARPGQQLAYLVGFKRFVDLRATAAAALGADFNLPRFHDTLLSWGALPFDMLQERLQDCLNAACLTPSETPHSPAVIRRGLQ